MMIKVNNSFQHMSEKLFSAKKPPCQYSLPEKVMVDKIVVTKERSIDVSHLLLRVHNISYGHLCTKTIKTIYLNFLRDARHLRVCDDSRHICHIFLENRKQKTKGMLKNCAFRGTKTRKCRYGDLSLVVKSQPCTKVERDEFGGQVAKKLRQSFL